MSFVLGPNRYGKAENRVVRIYRDTARHEIRDLNVTTTLRGDFTAAHVEGDQSHVLTTDTQKNTAFAYAKHVGVSSPEEYALALGERLLAAAPAATASRVKVEEFPWERVKVAGAGHDHTFVRRGDEVRTAVVVHERGSVPLVVSGFHDLVVLKSTGSEFKGFLREEYTTLEDADERILATSLTARWRHTVTGGVDWDVRQAAVRQTCLEAFAGTYSRALQQTLYAMGVAVLHAHPDLAEIEFVAPNKHHFLVDLSPFGVDNDGEVFIAADRPYGLIEARVQREAHECREHFGEF
jgi:urate oxidase